jgi:hypothetical protein
LSKYDLVDHYQGVAQEVVITVITLGEQYGQDKQVTVAWQVFCSAEALLFLFLGTLYDVSDQSCPSWNPRYLKGKNCRENGSGRRR